MYNLTGQVLNIVFFVNVKNHLKAMYHMGHVTRILLIFRNNLPYIDTKRDIVLKFGSCGSCP